MTTYTIPELEKMLSRIPPHVETSDPAVHLARQLLDTLRRVEAVLALSEYEGEAAISAHGSIYNSAIQRAKRVLTKGE